MSESSLMNRNDSGDDDEEQNDGAPGKAPSGRTGWRAQADETTSDR
jgi:hypothetical protein